MIGPSGTVRVMLATRPVDFRKGMDGLAMLVREQLGADPFCGTVFAFRSKRADRLKLLFFDGTGVVLVAKMRIPTMSDGKSDLKPDAVPTRSRTAFRSEAGHQGDAPAGLG